MYEFQTEKECLDDLVKDKDMSCRENLVRWFYTGRDRGLNLMDAHSFALVKHAQDDHGDTSDWLLKDNIPDDTAAEEFISSTAITDSPFVAEAISQAIQFFRQARTWDIEIKNAIIYATKRAEYVVQEAHKAEIREIMDLKDQAFYDSAAEMENVEERDLLLDFYRKAKEIGLAPEGAAKFALDMLRAALEAKALFGKETKFTVYTTNDVEEGLEDFIENLRKDDPDEPKPYGEL